jgi:DNA-binding Xre family transcriptional regulator
MKVSNKEIAAAINKTPSAISYLKKTNMNEFQILKLGVLCQKLNLDNEDLLAMYSLKQIELKKMAAS